MNKLGNFFKILLDVDRRNNPNEYQNQPERSKRENLDDLGHEWTGIPLTEEVWCIKCKEENHVIEKTRMRCSEHSGD